MNQSLLQKDTEQTQSNAIALLKEIIIISRTAANVDDLFAKVNQVLRGNGKYSETWFAGGVSPRNSIQLDAVTSTISEAFETSQIAINHFEVAQIKNVCVAVPFSIGSMRYMLVVLTDRAIDDDEIEVLSLACGYIEQSGASIELALRHDHAKRDLERAYERLNYHINNTPLAVIERDRNMKITYWSKRAEEMFGWAAEEVHGKSPIDFMVHPEDLENINALKDLGLEGKIDSEFHERQTLTKTGKVIFCRWYYSVLKDNDGKLDTLLSFTSDVTEQHETQHKLGERVKELKTLYALSQRLSDDDLSMEEVLKEIPSMITPGWQHPSICEARLTVLGRTYMSPGFRTSENRQTVPLTVNHQAVGELTIVYLEKTPEEFEGPFLREERHLINVIGEMLQVYLLRKQEEEELDRAQANLKSTINNSDLMIWSVDANLHLLTFNEPFKNYARERFNIDLKTGTKPFSKEITEKWNARYRQALTSGGFIVEESIVGLDYRFSLNPIIEHGRVTGVSVFADNVTDRNKRNQELADANKKITELKLMALRSVMNPHFIFNVLSSIQYFITRNDELNAINYLTSFSKLMRAVLTRSASDLVVLKEEIDLLREYILLEKLRFEDKFDFQINCDTNVDTESIKIPSLLIQPYVENAILHGLYNKADHGVLTIHVSREKEFLHFEIIDDGVGRREAGKIKARSQASRNSMGTQLTEERLSLLNSDGLPPVSYTDLDVNGAAAGTKVKIRIKLGANG